MAIVQNAAGRVNPAGINNQTGTSYTLALTDAGKMITLTNAAEITLTVPANSSVEFPIGTRIYLQQGGAGEFEIDREFGVTLQEADGFWASASQYSVATLTKIAEDTWMVSGDLAAADFDLTSLAADNIGSGRVIFPPGCSTAYPNQFAVGTNISGSGMVVYEWDGTTLSNLASYPSGGNNAAFHPSGDYIALPSKSNILVLSWNGTDTLSLVESVAVTFDIYSLSTDWHPSGNFLAVSGYNNPNVEVYSWNGSDTLTLLDSINAQTNATKISISDDDKYIVFYDDTALTLNLYYFNGSTLTLKDQKSTSYRRGTGGIFYGDYFATEGVTSSSSHECCFLYKLDRATETISEVSSFTSNCIGHYPTISLDGKYLFVGMYNDISGNDVRVIEITPGL